MSSEGNLPIPDPTVLTTAQILREVQHLRQLIEERMGERDQRYQQRADAQENALEGGLATTALAVRDSEVNLRHALTHLDALTESKFVTHRSMSEAQAAQVALALEAADKAVTKAETGNEKRYESLVAGLNHISDQNKAFVTRPEFEAMRTSMSEKIDDLKAFALRTEGRGAGLSAGWGYLLGAVGLAITTAGIMLALRTGH